MGNKTRKQHNVTVKSQAPETLKFPFHAVDRATMIFGSGIPAYHEVLKACPPEFQAYRNQWNQAANHIFFNGCDKRSLKFRSGSQQVASQQWAYFRTWLGSFEPKHEDKSAVCGWLLSLMLVECPRWK